MSFLGLSAGQLFVANCSSVVVFGAQVKYVQARDQGEYECQVSTEPKMSHFVTLNVVGK